MNRLALAVSFLCCRVVLGSDAGPVPVSEPAKVEFREVGGVACLQPSVASTDAELKDFRVAEQRWLAAHYPGQAALRWRSVLVLPSEPDATAKTPADVKTETAFVQAGDGSEIEVCFSIELKSTGAQAHE